MLTSRFGVFVVVFAGLMTFSAARPIKAGLISAIDRGWWDSTGYHLATNGNTFTGHTPSANPYGIDYNSFFVFDLSSVSGPVTSATLRLELEEYLGPDPSEMFTVYDVSTPTAELTASNSGQTSIFDDLQSGTVYATATVAPSQAGSVVTVALSSAAIASINSAAGSTFAVGLHLDDASWRDRTEGVKFSQGEESRIHQLELTESPSAVPEPSALVLCSLGLATAAIARRIRRNRFQLQFEAGLRRGSEAAP